MLTPDGSNIYVTHGINTTAVSAIDAATNNLIATIPVGNNPAGVAVTPDGAKIYVANFGSNTVSVIIRDGTYGFYKDRWIDPRQNLIFLHHIAREISRPIARDDRVHVEYVPTQVVTEFFRTVATRGESNIDGIAYRSSRRTGKSSMVLFVEQTNLVMPEDSIRLRATALAVYRGSARRC